MKQQPFAVSGKIWCNCKINGVTMLLFHENALQHKRLPKSPFLYLQNLWHILMVNTILMSPMREMMARLVDV
jgi:hypothetical protein